jgi:hypothetical protein
MKPALLQTSTGATWVIFTIDTERNLARRYNSSSHDKIWLIPIVIGATDVVDLRSPKIAAMDIVDIISTCCYYFL